MGESTDSSSDSDESIEAQERSDEFGIGQDTSQSQGFSSSDAEASYNQAQNAMAQAVATGQSPTSVGAVGLADTIGLDAFGGIGGASSTQSTAGMQSSAGDMLGGSMSITDPNTGQTTTYSPDQVPALELMKSVPYDIFNVVDRVNKTIKDRDAQGLYSQVTRDAQGNVTGVFDTNNVLGFDVKTYTGFDDNPYNEDRSYMDSNEGIVPTVTNPMTGKEQCPDGYVFDNDLQACRLKTKSDDAVGTPKDPVDMNAPAFTRNYALLNTAPGNVPQGFNYNQANQDFMSRFATRPSIFKNPPNLLGFTPFRSS